MWIKTDSAADCDPSCLTCDGSNSSSCLTCPDGSYLFSGECVSECPVGTFPLDNNNTCLGTPCGLQRVLTLEADCDLSCRTCENSADTCTSCNPGTYLFQSTCSSTCPDGTFPNVDVCQSRKLAFPVRVSPAAQTAPALARPARALPTTARAANLRHSSFRTSVFYSARHGCTTARSLTPARTLVLMARIPTTLTMSAKVGCVCMLTVALTAVGQPAAALALRAVGLPTPTA